MSGPGAVAPAARILVVEDDPEIQYLLSQILREDDREVILAGTAADGERLLGSGAIHLLVLDLLLPDADGRALLRSLRARTETATLPVIVVSGRVGGELRSECFELGADAFVEKPFDPDALASDVAVRLQRAASRARRETQDALTGLLNLAGLLQALGTLEGRRRALVVAELDGLRSVADRFGWATAEMIVSEVGKALHAAVPHAALARLAGGEFALAAACDDESAARTLAATVLDAVRRVPVRGPDGETFRMTASVGFLLDPGRTEGPRVVGAVRALVERAQDRGGNGIGAPASAAEPEPAAPLVLVAEDDDITAKILVHRLTKDGFEVVRFDNGNDAYRSALARTPALVVLDVRMPGMDGYELLERLRKTPSYAAVPIMMLTGMGSETDVVRGFELGADDYLLKPFSPVELLARIRRLLRRGRSAA
ncbi:MAG TPA: response regulator [Longimicrobiales bacterium]|nr:response regulator [Longimicrobiales bacterium]